MQLSKFVPVDQAVPVYVKDLDPGDRFVLWWDNESGYTERRVRGQLLRSTAGYARVHISYDEEKEVDFRDSRGKAHHFNVHKTETTEWSPNTLVVKEEDDMGDVKEVVDGINGDGSKIKKLVPKDKGAKAKAKGNGKAAALEAVNDCLCGCGEKVRRNFKPGHDARYYSQLKKVVAGDLTFSKLSKPAQKLLVDNKGVKAALAAHSKH